MRRQLLEIFSAPDKGVPGGNKTVSTAETRQGVFPPVLHVQRIHGLLLELGAVKIAAAVDEYADSRVQPVDQIVAPLIGGEDVRGNGSCPIRRAKSCRRRRRDNSSDRIRAGTP